MTACRAGDRRHLPGDTPRARLPCLTDERTSPGNGPNAISRCGRGSRPVSSGGSKLCASITCKTVGGYRPGNPLQPEVSRRRVRCGTVRRPSRACPGRRRSQHSRSIRIPQHPDRSATTASGSTRVRGKRRSPSRG